VLIPLLIASAWASPTYPGQLVDDLAIPCTPVCTVCHTTNSGGDGTVTADFGLAMIDAGLTGGSDFTALQTALDTLAADGTDSDGDGTLDVEELSAGYDPNPDGVAFCDVLTPTYGCIGSAVPAPASGIGVLAGLVGLASLRRKSIS
jgi:hypothetical protein